ncbi:MAG: hypothetical protein OXQ28_08885, partial [Acidobacteriota bacterium]|nr:hypothetical protein [Acidobacteriota bacterium]
MDEMVRQFGGRVRHSISGAKLDCDGREAPAERSRRTHVDDAAGTELGRQPPDRSRVFFTRGYRIGSDERVAALADDDLRALQAAAAQPTPGRRPMSATDVVQGNTAENEYAWFKLGLLLGALRTHLPPVGKPSLQALRTADAIEICIGRPHFWPRLETRVCSLV